jgi:hypothetical protein
MSASLSWTSEAAMRREKGGMTTDSFRCRICDDVIGVYEPLVLCTGSGSRITSRAAESALDLSGGTYYHRPCFEQQNGFSGA